MFAKFKLLLSLLLVCGTLLTPAAILSQVPSETKTLDSTLVNQPKAIPVINIIQEMENINKILKQIENKIEPSKRVIEIDSLIPVQAELIKDRQSYVQNFIKANPNRQKVDNQINKWNGYRDYLNGWESTINVYEQRNAILAEEILPKEQVWELTYQNAIEENVPPELLTNVKSVLDEVLRVSKKIKNENIYFLRLESKINNQNLIIEEVIEELIALKNSDVYKLFYLRHPPLWKTSFKTEKTDSDKKAGVESVSENIRNIFNFAKSSENDIYLFFIVIGLVIAGIIYIRKGYLKYEIKEPYDDLQKAKDLIVNKTVWGIMFISFLCARFFFINTPQLFDDILVFLILVCAMPLVQTYMDKRFKNIIYFVIFLFILDTAKTYFWFSSPHYRIYLLIEATLVAATVLYFTYPYLKTRELYQKQFGGFLIRLTPTIYLLLIISIVSNILGYTNLTDLTIKICTQSSELTIVFYAIWKMTKGITLGAIHSNFSRRKHFDPIKKRSIEIKILQILRVSVSIFWAFYFLKMIDLLRPFSEFINSILTEPYKVGSITFTLGVILTFIAILVISFLITSFISFLLDGKDVDFKIIKLPKGIPAAISLVIRYFILAFGIVLALSSLGIDLSKFNLMAGALGLGIGFGLQNIISNFISGIILVFERPILPGDTVEVNNLLGTVNKIGVRSSRISTYDGAEVVVPNNNLISNDLINWTLSDTIKRIEIVVGTTYESDPNKIIKVLTEVANEHKDVLKTPPARALFTDFGESALNFKVLFWVHFENGLQAKSDISVAIYNRFKELDIEIPFPQRVVHFPQGLKDIQKSENEIISPKEQKPERGS
ncbi:mechanosensitive ion channel domain-containing protein [Bacteroidota bacterium]